MQRSIVISEGEFYHIYNRGVEKRTLFLNQNDRERFLRLLYVANGERAFVYRDIEKKSLLTIDRGEPLVGIGAYVLMPNHFHILVKEITEGGISAFMEKLQTGYAAYFNKRHNRVGALFQGTYKAQHADSDEYLKYLYAYIHLNPLKLKYPKWKELTSAKQGEYSAFLEKFRYSSYHEYVLKDPRDEAVILSLEHFPDYFAEQRDFVNYLDDWVELKSEFDAHKPQRENTNT